MTKRIALVTGGMGGIGQATCKKLHDLGINVIAGYTREKKSAIEWQKQQAESGYLFDIAYANITDFKACEELVHTLEKKHGRIDILINNAGICRDVSCRKMTQEDWDIVLNTDLNGTFYITRAIINGMIQRQFGRIVNISSINGQRGQCGQVNYAAAKAGMHGFTKSLAREVAKKHITVNTISPGYVLTDMITSLTENVRDSILAEIPMGRFATPEEVAHVIAFLVDEKSSYITGANIAVNGGHYML